MSAISWQPGCCCIQVPPAATLISSSPWKHVNVVTFVIAGAGSASVASGSIGSPAVSELQPASAARQSSTGAEGAEVIPFLSPALSLTSDEVRLTVIGTCLQCDCVGACAGLCHCPMLKGGSAPLNQVSDHCCCSSIDSVLQGLHGVSIAAVAAMHPQHAK